MQGRMNNKLSETKTPATDSHVTPSHELTFTKRLKRLKRYCSEVKLVQYMCVCMCCVY